MGYWEQIGEERRKWEESRRGKRVNWEDVVLTAAGIAFWIAFIAYFVIIFSQ